MNIKNIWHNWEILEYVQSSHSFYLRNLIGQKSFIDFIIPWVNDADTDLKGSKWLLIYVRSLFVFPQQVNCFSGVAFQLLYSYYVGFKGF